MPSLCAKTLVLLCALTGALAGNAAAGSRDGRGRNRPLVPDRRMVTSASQPSGALRRGARAALPRPLPVERARLHHDLRALAESLETRAEKDPVGLAVEAFRLERRAIHFLLRLADLPAAAFSRMHKPAAMEDARGLIRRARELHDRVGEHAITAVRKAVPGEPLTRLSSVDGRDVYLPLNRVDSFASHAQAQNPNVFSPASEGKNESGRKMYREQLARFLAKGGRLTDIKLLTPSFLRDLPQGALFNWTIDPGDPDKVTVGPGSATHVVLAGHGQEDKGEDEDIDLNVAGAGDGKVWKDRHGQPVLAMPSRSSGRFKPFEGSLELMRQALERGGIPGSSIISSMMTADEPLAVKLFLMSKPGVSGETIRARLEALEREPALVRWRR